MENIQSKTTNIEQFKFLDINGIEYSYKVTHYIDGLNNKLINSVIIINKKNEDDENIYDNIGVVNYDGNQITISLKETELSNIESHNQEIISFISQIKDYLNS